MSCLAAAHPIWPSQVRSSSVSAVLSNRGLLNRGLACLATTRLGPAVSSWLGSFRLVQSWSDASRQIGACLSCSGWSCPSPFCQSSAGQSWRIEAWLVQSRPAIARPGSLVRSRQSLPRLVLSGRSRRVESGLGKARQGGLIMFRQGLPGQVSS
jgi:hypothetical protein